MTDKLLPYEIIVRAVIGDAEAIGEVIKHFDAYINRLSQRPVLSMDNTKTYYLVNEDIKLELYIELIVKLPRFDPTKER